MYFFCIISKMQFILYFLNKKEVVINWKEVKILSHIYIYISILSFLLYFLCFCLYVSQKKKNLPQLSVHITAEFWNNNLSTTQIFSVLLQIQKEL